VEQRLCGRIVLVADIVMCVASDRSSISASSVLVTGKDLAMCGATG
jgi:hypothetical protein